MDLKFSEWLYMYKWHWTPACFVEDITREIINEIYDLAIGERGLNVPEIASAVGISTSWIRKISDQYLNTEMLSRRWLPLCLQCAINKILLCVSGTIHAFHVVSLLWTKHEYPITLSETKEKSRPWIASGESAPSCSDLSLSHESYGNWLLGLSRIDLPIFGRGKHSHSSTSSIVIVSLEN